MSRLENYFLKESLLTEKEDDEVGPNARPTNSDDEGSDDEGMKLAHAHDPAGPWARNVDVPEPVRRAAMAQHARDQGAAHMTGVKGVLADYKEHQQQQEIERERAKLEREYVLDRIANGVTYTTAHIETPSIFDPNVEKASDGSDGDDDELLDAEFMAQYRAQRLQDLQAEVHRVSLMYLRPVFGEVKEVDKFEFVEEVDKADKSSFVVVHLYEEYISSCRLANNFLEKLARTHTGVKFLRMKSTDAKANYDQAVLPALLVYKAGDLVDSLFRIIDDIGAVFTLEDLEEFLTKHKVLE